MKYIKKTREIQINIFDRLVQFLNNAIKDYLFLSKQQNILSLIIEKMIISLIVCLNHKYLQVLYFICEKSYFIFFTAISTNVFS